MTDAAASTVSDEDGFAAFVALYNADNRAGAEQAIEAQRQRTNGTLSLRVAELLAQLKLELGKPSESLEVLALTKPYRADSLQQLYNTGVALINSGRPLEGIEPLRRAAELFPDVVAVHRALVAAVGASDNPAHYKLTQDHARRITELEPENADAFFHYGQVLSNSSRELEAVTAFQRALELRPVFAGAWQGLGSILLQLDRMDEAVAAFERAVEQQPGIGEATRQLAQLRKRARRRERVARYPRSQKEFDDQQKLIERYIVNELEDVQPLLTLESRVFTLGSCFSTNIALSLRKYGVAAENIRYPDDINNTYANRYLLEWLLGDISDSHANYETTFGSDFRREQVTYLKACDVIIISLGVAPCFFDKVTGEFVLTFGINQHVALHHRDYNFRTTTVAENVENLTAIVRMLRELNPAMKIFLTVSPVPLSATFERSSSIIADCVSKSTLRVAAEEVLRFGIEELYYWPSFEIVRWAGGHWGSVFGTDDGSPFHVSQALIDRIMYTFVKTFGAATLVGRAEASNAAAQAAN